MSVMYPIAVIMVSALGTLGVCGLLTSSLHGKCLEISMSQQPQRWQGTLLHKAVLNLDETKVRKLLAVDVALVNAKDSSGQTALFYTVSVSATEPPFGMNGTMSDKEKRLRMTARRREIVQKEKLLDLLLAAGSDAATRDKSRLTPLLAAALRPLPYAGKESPVIAKLIKAGADIDAQDQDGTTALMIASVRGDKQLRLQLLKAGAKTALKRCDGQTADSLMR
jgi:ankyrin repeat protein